MSKQKRVNPLRVNPLRVDPTRTGWIVRQYRAEMRRRFDLLSRFVTDLVDTQDAFGLRPLQTLNVFCPTGPGGGIDPTCSPSGRRLSSGNKIVSKSGNPITVFHGTANEFDEFQDGVTYFSPNPAYSYVWRSPKIIEAEVHMVNPYYTESQSDIEGVAYWPDWVAELKAKGYDGVVYAKKNNLLKGPSGWGNDYPQYAVFSKDQIKIKNRYDNEEFQLGIQLGDVEVTTNARYSFQTTAEQVRSFSREIAGQIERLILGAPEDEERAWWTKFITQGFKQGAGRVFDDVKKRASSYLKQSMDFFNGTREEFFRQSFARPETVEKIQLLAGRNFTELKGVTDQMANVMSRTLTEGLSQGENPRVLAKKLRDQISDISERRAETIARTEIIRAHAEGQLQAFESLGIEEIRVAVEWSTAGDSQVCSLCSALEGIVVKVSEAKGLLPRHPDCRCAFIPANVGEPTEEQLKSRSRIQQAVARSISLERKKGTIAEKRAKSRWVGAGLSVSKKRPVSGIPVIR